MFYQKNKITNNNSESLKRWIWSLISVLVFCLFSYGYFVRGAIVNIVERQSMETEFSILNSKVSSLESDYIKTKNNITPELATTLGFVPVSNQKFVTRTIQNSGLSLLTKSLK